VAPLTDLIRKDTNFRWTDIENAIFKRLKYIFISTPVLKHFDPDYKTFIECDSLGYAVEDALMQYNKEGVL
jgi:hypothetical protein